MIARKNYERVLLKQRILDDMQNRTEEDVLKVYKDADRITRNQMWIRFPALRRAFEEMNDGAGIDWQISEINLRTEWYKKKI